MKGALLGFGKTVQGNRDRFCSFCHKQGHGGNRILDKPHRDTSRSNCSMKVHSEATWWSRRRKDIAARKVSVAIEGSSNQSSELEDEK